MLEQGPIPRFVHGVIEYAAAALFILAPFILDFDSGAATAISIIVGVVVLVVAATTEGPTSLSGALPLSIHILLDYALAAVLIAVPFIFGFSDESEPTAFFIAVGVVHLLVTIATRFHKEEGEKGGRGRRRRRREPSPAGAEGGQMAAGGRRPGGGSDAS